MPSGSGLQSLPLLAGRVPGQGQRTERGTNEKAWGSPLCTHVLWDSMVICVDRDDSKAELKSRGTREVSADTRRA